jgi:hypothetical protein
VISTYGSCHIYLQAAVTYLQEAVISSYRQLWPVSIYLQAAVISTYRQL